MFAHSGCAVGEIGLIDDLWPALRVHQDFRSWMLRPSDLHLFCGEVIVHIAVAVPGNDLLIGMTGHVGCQIPIRYKDNLLLGE